jgi:hypothetical protein
MLAQGVGGTGQDPRVGRRVRAPTSPRGRRSAGTGGLRS